jgi:hypothetical protein
VVTDRFLVLKKTGALADATAAVGLAVLLEALTGESPMVGDEGPYYAVTLDKPVDLGALSYHRLKANPGYPYVQRSANDDPPLHSEVIDYQVEKSKLEAARQARKSRKAGVRIESESEAGAAADEVRPDWFLFQQLNVLQAYGSYTALHEAVREADPEELGEALKAKLEAMVKGRDPASVETSFSIKVSPVQGFNPLVGKGVNRLKPDGAPVLSLRRQYADWFEEWLRYAGTVIVGNASPVGDDTKFVALAPGRMRLDHLRRQVRSEFLAAAGRVWTSSLLDVCCALRVARRLIEGSGLAEGDKEWELLGATPRDLISGIYTAYFKSLGTGRAVSNLSFIGLPGWFPVTDAESARDWLSILDEHLGIVSYLREDRTEEYTLISLYRDFLSANDLRCFIAFAAAYAPYVMSRREDKRPVRQLTTSNLGKVVKNMEKRYSSIVENEGFRNIARAIRRATVTEQFHKAQRRTQVYEIHYGLFHELRRSAAFPEKLCQAVADFVASYNAENARLAERLAKPGRELPRRRDQVTTRDLEEFTRLVDEFGSETVGYLLVAYGSAREPREAEPSEAEVGSEPAEAEAP